MGLAGDLALEASRVIIDAGRARRLMTSPSQSLISALVNHAVATRAVCRWVGRSGLVGFTLN